MPTIREGEPGEALGEVGGPIQAETAAGVQRAASRRAAWHFSASVREWEWVVVANPVSWPSRDRREQRSGPDPDDERRAAQADGYVAQQQGTAAGGQGTSLFKVG